MASRGVARIDGDGEGEKSIRLRACGHEALAWSGQCARLRRVEHAERGPDRAPRRRRGAAARRLVGRAGGPAGPAARRRSAPEERLPTGIGELDRVLGGGLVPGSLVLLGGAPGIGKSTITAMALGNLAAAGRRTLYVTGEESAAQVRMRAERLGEGALVGPGPRRDRARRGRRDASRPRRPRSASSTRSRRMHSAELTSAPGSVAQVREAAERPDGGREADRHRADPRRPRDQGGLGRGPARARAPGRLRARLRGRARALLPDPAGAQEPLRGDQRGRRLRDALGRPRRGRGPVRPLRRRGDAGARARSCSAPWRGRGRCSSRSRRSSRRPRSCRRGGSRTASTATGWRWCSRCSPATAASASARPTSSSTSPAASASTSPAPTSPSRSRSPRRTRGEPLGDDRGPPARLLRRGRPHRRAAPRRATPSGASPRRVSSASGPCSGRQAGERLSRAVERRLRTLRQGGHAAADRGREPGAGCRRSPRSPERCGLATDPRSLRAGRLTGANPSPPLGIRREPELAPVCHTESA